MLSALLRPTHPGFLLAVACAGAGLLAMLSGLALAQTGPGARAGIYTCIDASGRRITSDRPIPQCLDREQQELTGSGTVKRVIPPSYTADERARLEAERRREAEAQARIADEKRRDKALLLRYPNKAVHDKERTEVLAQIDEVMLAVNRRVETLRGQRRDIDNEMEFYQKDPSQAPAWLKRKLEDNEQEMDTQRRFLQTQTEEKGRVNARFDDELARLRKLWQEFGQQ